MTLTLSSARESDAPRITNIHMEAFKTNAMLLAQFPTPGAREGLKMSLVRRVIDEIRDPKWAILVVRDNERKGELVSFAKWHLPILPSEDYQEVPWRWPEGTDIAVLDKWTEKVEVATRKILGDRPCYHLSFIATDPVCERRGAGSLLMQWGLEQCRMENTFALLESTMDAAPFYTKLGFKEEEEMSMLLDGVGGNSDSVLYEEMSFVFRP